MSDLIGWRAWRAFCTGPCRLALPVLLGVLVAAAGAAVETGPGPAPSVVATPLMRPRALVLHVHADIRDQGFLPDLIRRLERTLAPPIFTLPTRFDLGLLRAQGHPLDAAVLVDHLIRSVDWGHNAGTIQVLLIPDDLRLRPARYNFAASNGTAASPYHVIVVSLARLQDRGLWSGDDRHPGRTAERVQKLVAKNAAKVAGYGGSTRCIFSFPRNRDELDALPEGFCEPDLSALVAAGIARPLR